jgi:GT2 family glycosyltransferase
MLTTPTLAESSAAVRHSTDGMPLRILEIELGKPLPTLSATDEKTGSVYQSARCLIRLHDHPLGMLDLQFDKHELEAEDYAQYIWRALHERIAAHLRQDGLPLPTRLDRMGLACPDTPLCTEEREAFFATAPFVSIIVSTHDRTEQLAQCLPSLLAQHYPHYEVVIVDNAPSSSATFDFLQQTYGGMPKLRYVREDRPGLSRGLNQGIKTARGEILAFTDDDVVVDAYWLLHLARAFSVTDDVASVTGLVAPLELETRAQILFEEYGGFCKGFSRRVYDLADNHPGEPLFPYTAGRFGTGASMAFRADFLRSVGGFDPALQCGMDIAAFFQAIKQGHKLVYEPAAIAYHGHRREYTALQKQLYNYGVGLTGYLTKNVLEHPLCLLELVTKLPYGLFFMLSTRSPKNQKKLLHYPKELTMLERKGMLQGPYIYLRRRRKLSLKTIG